jgi:hypothetical protein
MREADLEGLRAAARVAFSVALLGCGTREGQARGPDVVVGPPQQPPPTQPYAPPAPRPPVDCETLFKATFPFPDYPGKKVAADPELLACCEAVITTAFPERSATLEPYRWDCCAQFDLPSNSDRASACTPWGPPTPPSIRGTHPPPGTRSLDLRAEARAIALPIDAHGPLRDAAIATWRARMENEHASACVFSALAAQLDALGWRDDAVEVAAFAREEVSHGVRCGAVVEALGGDARGDEPVHAPFPLHADAVTPREAALRNAVAIGCLSETVAVALIGAERAAMPEGPLRELLTSIWADEIGHARFGWRLLDRVASDLDDAERASLERYLEVALEHLVDHELAHLPAGFEPPEGGASVGLCNGAAARRLFAATLDQVIIPALAQRGLRPRAPRSRSSRSEAQHAGAPSRTAGTGRRRASSPAPGA